MPPPLAPGPSPLPSPERRFLPAGHCPVKLQARASDDPSGDLGEILGYGAVFWDGDPQGGTQYQLYSDLCERIMPTAFDRALREGQDVLGLFNHNADLVLGRTSAGTMKCSVDKKGLAYAIDCADTSIARDVCQHLTRGDVNGSSFGFRVVREMYVAGGDNAEDVREIHDVDLYDIGPVTFPAYSATTAEVRNAYEAWKATRTTTTTVLLTSRAQAQARARLVELDAGR